MRQDRQDYLWSLAASQKQQIWLNDAQETHKMEEEQKTIQAIYIRRVNPKTQQVYQNRTAIILHDYSMMAFASYYAYLLHDAYLSSYQPILSRMVLNMNQKAFVKPNKVLPQFQATIFPINTKKKSLHPHPKPSPLHLISHNQLSPRFFSHLSLSNVQIGAWQLQQSTMLQREWTLNDSDLLALEFQKTTQALPSKNQCMREVHLHQIRRIENYLKINKPLLSQARREIIEEKLELEKVAQRQTRERIRTDEYIVRYDYNPLSEKENERQNRSRSKQLLKSSYSARKLSNKGKGRNIREETEEEQVGLVDALNGLKSRPFRRDYSQILKTTAMSKHLSSQINFDAKNLSYNLGAKGKSKEKQAEETELTFENILEMADNNYYAQHQGPINIFQFMRGDLRSIVTKDILKNYYFNFTSCLEKMQRYKVYIYRQISQLARNFVMNSNIAKSVRLDVLNSAELSISIKDIRFGDLISIGSGRLDPPLVYAILYEGNAQKDGSPSASIVQDEEPINYLPTQHQKKTDYQDELNLKEERDRYLMLENSPFQEKCVRRYQKIQKEIAHNIDIVRNIKRSTINDKKIHDKYRKIISKDLQLLADVDKRRKEEPEKLIRENKISKNRQERLKIKELLKAVQITNQYHQMLDPIITPRKPKP